MTIPVWLWWLLAASAFVALIIMATTYFLMKKRIKRIKIRAENKALGSNRYLENKALARSGHGDLLWDHKAKKNNSLGDLSLEFLINTCLRNQYKEFYIVENRHYEEDTLKKIASMKLNVNNFDFALLFYTENVNSDFDFIYKKINEKGMIAIVNGAKSKEMKKLNKYLNLIGVKFDTYSYNDGLTLVVK